jgi:cytochrome oxidase Cu insertion factor (SCO1/SenC/PrrC family)
MVESAASATSRRSRAQLWILVAIFFAPLLSAFALYYGSGWRPAKTTNHGALIAPPRPLPAVSADSTQSQLFHGKWSLVYLVGATCSDACQQALLQIRQVRLALGDDMRRVQRVLLVFGPCCNADDWQQELPGLITVHVPPTHAQPLLQTFQASAAPPTVAGQTYVIDPLGNLMMSYAPQSDNKGMLEDLKRLLKLSHIG